MFLFWEMARLARLYVLTWSQPIFSSPWGEPRVAELHQRCTYTITVFKWTSTLQPLTDPTHRPRCSGRSSAVRGREERAKCRAQNGPRAQRGLLPVGAPEDAETATGLRGDVWPVAPPSRLSKPWDGCPPLPPDPSWRVFLRDVFGLSCRPVSPAQIDSVSPTGLMICPWLRAFCCGWICILNEKTQTRAWFVNYSRSVEWQTSRREGQYVAPSAPSWVALPTNSVGEPLVTNSRDCSCATHRLAFYNQLNL